MASDYFRVNSSNQTVTGTEANELFEIVPSSSSLSNLRIITGGGQDTIKITDQSSVGFTATVEGFNDQTVLDFSESKYGSAYSYGSSRPLLYRVQSDGILMSDSEGKFSIKFADVTDYNILDNAVNSEHDYKLLTITTTKENEYVPGTSYDDEITLNHPRASVFGSSGNDTIIANTDNNTIYPGSENDLVILNGNSNYAGRYAVYYNLTGNDAYISTGKNNYISDTVGTNNFIIGGDENTVVGSSSADKFFIYSYESSGANVTLTGEGNNDNYYLTTGLVGVDGLEVGSASYKTSSNDTINVAITEIDSLDTITFRSKDLTSIEHEVAADGIHIYDNTKRINVLLPGIHDWDAIKGMKISYNNLGDLVGTTTLEDATDLTSNGTTTTLSSSNGTTTTLSSSNRSHFFANDGKHNNLRVIDASATSDNKIIVGNTNSNSILGGSGQNSLWGGGQGDNTLTGGSSRDKFWHTGGGNEVVTNFSSGSGSTSDVIVLQAKNYSGVSRNGSTVSMNMTNGKSMKLNTNSSSGDGVFLYSADGNNVYGAKVGGSSDKTLTYTSDANFYQLNGGGTLNVNTSNNVVALNGSTGETFVGIQNISVSAGSNNIVVGNGSSNSITGGSGNSSLWGSAANANDTLIGGSGTDMFWYGRGEGNDVITNSTEKDSVNFYNLKLSDISSIDYSTKSVAISFNSGQKVTVNDSGGTSAVMMFEGGQRWKYNHSSGNWQQG